ncbi:MAG TPA: DUF177 domain-containing protein [Clostridiales bacterium]|nr:DUF177 domain-containing protein [Clostridiales bacterium]
MSKLQLEPLFLNEGLTLDVDQEVPCTEVDEFGNLLFPQPFKVTGQFENEASVVTLHATIGATLYTVCDRCATEVVLPLSVPMEHTFVTELNGEDRDERFVLVPDMLLDLDRLATEDLFLNLPTKVLCKDDCKGICPQCGKNLNEGPCRCQKSIDPRLEGLLTLLDDTE